MESGSVCRRKGDRTWGWVGRAPRVGPGESGYRTASIKRRGRGGGCSWCPRGTGLGLVTAGAGWSLVWEPLHPQAQPEIQPTKDEGAAVREQAPAGLSLPDEEGGA